MTARGGPWRAADPVVGLGAMAAGAASAALGGTIVGLALSEHGITLVPGLSTPLALSGFTGLLIMVVAAWVLHVDRPGVAIGLSVATAGLVLPSWAAWDWMPDGIVPILQAAAPMAVAGATHAGVGWLRLVGRLPVALLTVYVVAAGGATVIAVGYNPLADPGCMYTCIDTDPVADSMVTTRVAVVTTAGLLVIAAAVAGWSIAGGARIPAVLRAGALAAVGLLVAGWVVRAVWWATVPAVAWVAAQVPAMVLLSAGALIAWWTARRHRIVAERLVTELNEAQALGRSVHGGHAAAFAVPGEARWVDVDGHDVPGRRQGVAHAVTLDADGESAVRIWSGPRAPAPALDSISTSARVALANAWLTAVIKARTKDVQDSRRRIIRASDAERIRIARDLHDGAQQRLISASLHISVAANRIPIHALERAQGAIGEALAQLRSLAHGLGPEPIGTEDMSTVLDELAHDAGVSFVLDMGDITVDDDVGIAIHGAVKSVLAHASTVGAHDVRVRVVRLPTDRVELRIAARGPSALDTWDETSIGDRIGAVGGLMSVRSTSTRLLIRAELPCAS
jgi:signal transduction histidine kinase